MKTASFPKWGQPDQRRLLLLLACMMLGVLLFACMELYRFRIMGTYRDVMQTQQTYLDLAQTVSISLRSGRLAFERLAPARQRKDVLALESRLDSELMLCRGLLVLMHQGGEFRPQLRGPSPSAAYFSLAHPMPDELLTQASVLVPQVQGILDQSALLTRYLLRLDGMQEDAVLPVTVPVRREVERLFTEAESAADLLVTAIRASIDAHVDQHYARVNRILALQIGIGGLLALLTFVLWGRSMAATTRLLGARDRDAETVAEANAGMERILEALPVGIAILGQDRIIRRVNLAATNLLDIEPGWLFERRIPWDMFCVNKPDSEQTPRTEFEHEVRMHALEGRTLDVIKSSIPVILQGETLILEVFMDVTLRKQAERELLQEKSRLESLLAGIDEGVALTDETGVVLEVNTSLCRILGIQRDELLGEGVANLFPRGVLESELADGLRSLKMDPHTRIREIHLESYRDMALVVRMQPVLREDVFGGMIVSIIEVTEIVESRRKAEAASQAKSMFLANMSHEIRTPMNSILGHGDLLTRTSLSAEQEECVQNIRVCAENLLVIINDILDFSKIEAGMLRIVPENVDLGHLLERTIAMFSTQAQKKGVELRLVTSGLPDVVRTDAGRLNQVLVNLLGNALKFTDRGSVELTVRGEAAREGLWAAHFSVHDTGIGISAERQQDIFSSFEQADGSLTRKYGGTGLGLTIADNLVRLLGGSGISVHSQPGQGSTFSFFLTMDVQTVSPASKMPVREVPESGGSFERIRVLAAEDNPFNRSLLMKALKNLQVETVTMVENGQKAVDILAAGQGFDIVLMDIQMPVLDGLKATRLIRGMGLTVPIIALTAHVLEDDQRKSMEAGMNGHLAKPYRLEDLALTLATWCT